MNGIASGLVGNLLGGVLGGVMPKQTVQARQGFKSFVQVEDGDAAYDTQAEVYGAIGAAGVWTTIWEMTVPAQQQIHWGFGSPNQPQNQGYMWFAMMDIAADWSVGTLRLVQQNARRTRKIVVGELPDSQLHSATVTTLATAALLNKNEMIALPEKVEYPLVGEDSLIGLEYSLITAATAADAAGFRIPITVYQ
ncbi:MAG: hypothetical protein D4S01_06435 [Dehalococcoidia bacterium]|nr:MAG: hypothetical protein D4S01_06435 [Dehalococcoidia bacterium]